MNRINANKKPDKMIILLFFSILSLTAISQNAEKKITIQNKNISLKEAFEQIELQTDYSIAYEQSNLNLKKRQALSLKSASIASFPHTPLWIISADYRQPLRV